MNDIFQKHNYSFSKNFSCERVSEIILSNAIQDIPNAIDAAGGADGYPIVKILGGDKQIPDFWNKVKDDLDIEQVKKLFVFSRIFAHGFFLEIFISINSKTGELKRPPKNGANEDKYYTNLARDFYQAGLTTYFKEGEKFTRYDFGGILNDKKITPYCEKIIRANLARMKWNENASNPYNRDFYEVCKYFEFNKVLGLSFDEFKIWLNGGTINMPVRSKTVRGNKPFILLAGISGTGKSRLVRLQATQGDASVKCPANYCLVPVRPDWHEPSDLLGYVSRIRAHDRYIPTEFLKFMVKAWDNATNKDGKVQIDAAIPYWLCLDEMNLAPVEQYFADYLSVLETREWRGENDYTCAPLLKAEVIKSLGAVGLDELKAELMAEIESDKAEKLWGRFEGDLKGIPLPPNLIVAGTVNMDETTHGFSRKVIDRALTLDFQEFFPNKYGAYWNQFEDNPSGKPKTFSFPTVSHIRKPAEMSNCLADAAGANTIAFMEAINEILKGTPFELAYRALNEALLAVHCQAPDKPESLQAVWDDFVMQKVLPRIEGDAAKLKWRIPKENLEVPDLAGKGTLIHKLYLVLKDQLADIWVAEFENNDPTKRCIKGRPDLMRVGMIEGETETALTIPCRSKKKLEWMANRLNANHFTDFWV